MLIVGNGLLLTLGEDNRVIEDGAVAVEGNLVKEIGLTAELRQRYPSARYLDARGKLIMPGMINTHMHLYSTFARGMALKAPPPLSFGQILERLWWRLDKALTLEDVYYSAMVSLVDCILNGTTTIIDHHASPMAIRGSLETIARATAKAGIRSCLCYEVSDRDGPEAATEGIRENEEFIAYCRARGDEMLAATFGLHASLTLSDVTLNRCREAAGSLGVGFHIHAAEGTEDVEDCVAKSGKRVIERLAASGILGPKTIAAHCVHVNEKEMEVLRETGTMVVHNPESNMANAVGCAPVLEMIHKGVKVGLGTDGYTTDMFESLKVAALLHKHARGNPSVAWDEVRQMVFVNNSSIAGAFFPRPLGEISPGAYADLIVVDYHPPTPLHEGNYYSHLLFGVSGGRVETTIVNGRILMENRRLAGIDEEELATKARDLATRLWERF